MVIGPDEDMIFIEVKGVSINRVFIPIAVIDVEDAAFIVIGVIHEGGIAWHRMGMAGYPQADLVMAGQDSTDISCRLDRIVRRRQADARTARYDRLFQRGMAEDDRRLLAMGGQGLVQPGQLLMGQFDGCAAGHGVRR